VTEGAHEALREREEEGHERVEERAVELRVTAPHNAVPQVEELSAELASTARLVIWQPRSNKACRQTWQYRHARSRL